MHDSNDAQAGDAGVVVRKRRKGIYILPNLFTLAALFGGFYAIVMAMNGRFDLAAIGVFCAMVLDSLGWPRGPHDQYPERVWRTDGFAVRHGVFWRGASTGGL